ncbi:peroxisomal biogenesis factor 2 [Pelomyxa schiedti]|nr:peroxisomal biogenesis factor 2 [Pelomyxa schiedti]
MESIAALGAEWNTAWRSASVAVHDAVSRSKSRVMQYDSVTIDDQLHEIIMFHLRKSLKLAPGDTLSKYEPEIVLLMSGLVWWFTVGYGGAPYGARLNNLDLVRASSLQPVSRKILAAHGIMTVGMRWANDRGSQMMIERGWAHKRDVRRKIWAAKNAIESAVKAASLLNILAFLFQGRYISLTNRVLGVTLKAHYSPEFQRVMMFDAMNKEVVWDTFTEFLAFMAPLVRSGWANSVSSRLRNLLWVKKAPTKPSIQVSVNSPQCAFCGSAAVNGCTIGPCGHTACYYCVGTALKRNQTTCPQCDAPLHKTPTRYKKAL